MKVMLIFFKKKPLHLGISYTYDISRANRYLIWKIISIFLIAMLMLLFLLLS